MLKTELSCSVRYSIRARLIYFKCEDKIIPEESQINRRIKEKCIIEGKNFESSKKYIIKVKTENKVSIQKFSQYKNVEKCTRIRGRAFLNKVAQKPGTLLTGSFYLGMRME